MFSLEQFFDINVLYFLLALFGLSLFRKHRWVVAAEFLVNLGFSYYLFFRKHSLGFYPLIFLVGLSALVYSLSRSRLRVLAFFIPALVLILSRYLPRIEMGDLALYFGGKAPAVFAATGLMQSVPLVGLSYLVFRWYRFLIDSPNSRSTLFSFLLYCFYVPIFYIGPITTFKEFSLSIQNEYKRTVRVFGVACLRMFWGAVKFYPLAILFYQLTFSRLLLNQNPHINLLQFFLAALAYPVYLYLNFSGFTDLVIGLSAVLGIHVDRNFDRPYLATSVGEFWRRWHISLTELLKDLIHIPTLKLLDKRGLRNPFLNYGLAVTLVFLVMAYWHGGTSSFYIFSGLQIIALVLQRSLRHKSAELDSVNKVWLKRLGLWLFLAVSFFFFENDPQQIQDILENIHF